MHGIVPNEVWVYHKPYVINDNDMKFILHDDDKTYYSLSTFGREDNKIACIGVLDNETDDTLYYKQRSNDPKEFEELLNKINNELF